MFRRGLNGVTWGLVVLLLLTALPADAAEQDSDTGEARRPWLGVFLGDAVDGGVQLMALVPGGPADLAGLKRGDVVVRAEELRITDVQELTLLLSRRRPGETLKLQVIRAGQPREHVVRLAPWSRRAAAPAIAIPPRPGLPAPPVAAPAPQTGCEAFGLSVTEVTPDLRMYFGAPAEAGILVTGIEPGRPAAAAGFRVGDVVVSVGDQPVRQVGDFEQLLSLHTDEREELTVASLIRDGEPTVITLPTVSVVSAEALLRSAAVELKAASGTSLAYGEKKGEQARRLLEQAVRLEIKRLQARIEQLQRELEALHEQP